MRWTILTPALATAAFGLALAAPASAAVGDFRLPSGSQTQPEPDRQGPVAPDVPESRRPAPTPTPSASVPAPAPTPAPSPTAGGPRVVASPPAEQSQPTASRTTRNVTTSSNAAGAQALPPGSNFPAAQPTSNATEALPSAGPSNSAPATASPAAPDEGSAWPLVLAFLAGLGLAGGAGFVWWRWRQATVPARVVATVERPSVVPPVVQKPASQPAPIAAAPAEPLQVTLEPLRLSLTLMNATLAYRLEVTNRGLEPIVRLDIGADMIAAHASMTREQQLSGPGNGATVVQQIERIEPGQTRIVEGEFRVPFSQIVPIRQGNAALLLPLARFRLEAESAKPLVRTFVVGQPGAGSNLQPFRLDLGPRVYPHLAQHAFA